ncbi:MULTISPECIES: polysaccharide biosynthesis/export family protein [Pseudoalteromonas]|uniref:Polysaccharide biosynthesis/export family protein n=1 Tax=Pseudoalteromonas obscura TaxID=3048491 RepID=A0ABT7EI71_9GAMM|nr:MULTISPECIES: polysaccharide biosynthesis/export family protein [Pseudoalteromonas]MBQ4836398.1 polysaccharide biosynthesis/export family protein [Pseudoalteromonas luteoviolacea]MDK2594748.1 polysaccharide biosynthesis/export family protein [Pseudoalteromonas sp. P94(2023)]
MTVTSLKNKLSILALLCHIALIAGCAHIDGTTELEDNDNRFYGHPDAQGTVINPAQPGTVFAAGLDCSGANEFAISKQYRVDRAITTHPNNQAPVPVLGGKDASSLPLSPGDLIEISMEYGEGFNGRYILDTSGLLEMPVIEPIFAAGLTTKHLSERIELALIRANIFKAHTLDVNIRVLNLAAIEVPVSGAVFEPGRVTINASIPSQVQQERLAASGDQSKKRLLSEAVRTASGIRPDAKLDQVILIRSGWQVEVDLTGILTGEPVTDYALIAGDQVIVPSTGCFQPHLVRPSQITPKGFRVFMSNLIDSAESNSNAAIGRFSSSLPYGTRLLQAAVSANCVGGKSYTNAPRRVVLVSTHPITKQTQVIERSIEQLMRMPYRDRINPYVMPNDAIACYDSDITNLRDVAQTVLDLVAPFKVF